MSATDVPVRIPEIIVQIDVECSTLRTIVRVTAKRKLNPYVNIISRVRACKDTFGFLATFHFTQVVSKKERTRCASTQTTRQSTG